MNCPVLPSRKAGTVTAMKLTHYSDYSLRVLIYLGLRDDTLSTITDIAGHYGISRNHVVKVVHRLGQLGYVDTLRGKNGGLRLARAPREINVGDVIRHTEANLNPVECFSDEEACVLTPVCVLRDALSDALAAFLQVLDGYTVEDLLAPRHELHQQLFFRAVPLDDQGASD